MSDRYNPLGVQGLIRPQAPAPPRFGMTSYERELDPYYDSLMEQERTKRNWLKPVQWIFDRLQTGQYISANLTNELIDAMDQNPDTRPQFLQAIWEGVTGKTKGSYENILRDRLNVGQAKVFANANPEGRLGQVDWADVLGFIGDIALDPMTYVGFGALGNSTKLAKSAADDFADSAVRIMFRRLGDDPKFAQRLLGDGARETIEQALGASTNKGLSMLRNAGGDLGRIVEQTYTSAHKAALGRTQRELLDFVRSAGDNIPTDIIENVATEGAFRSAGERFGYRLLGKEKSIHQTGAVKRAMSERNWDKFTRLFEGTDPGSGRLTSAVWGLLNRSPLGEMRRALGFRNPYQKYLRTKQLEEGMHFTTDASTQAVQRVMKPISGLSDDQLKEVWDVFAQRETAEVALREAVDRGGMALGAVPETIQASAPEITRAVDDLKGVMDEFYYTEQRVATALGESPADYRRWYLPEFFTQTSRSGRGTGGSVKVARQFTAQETIDREMDLLQAIWGVDRTAAYDMIQAGMSGVSTDVRTALANRALVHGRAVGRGNLLEQLKEFGLKTGDPSDPINAGIRITGRTYPELGLKHIADAPPNLQDYVFDKDVADIIERTLDVTGKNMNAFQKVMKAYSNWWKSIVTMTTGFHARNFMSNTVTQFLRHGTRAFKKDELMMSIAAVSHTLSESSRKAFLGQLGVTPEWMEKWLSHRVGNYTVRELAERASQEGVISRATMGFDAPSITERLTKRQGGALFRGEVVKPGQGNLWSKGALRDASRSVGSYVENIPRMQSFLIDYGDMAVNPATLNLGEELSEEMMAKAIAQADEGALKYAGREARKWFIDYSDLTDFEQKTMKSVVPFYSWLRKNLANQISGIALYPDLYSILPKIEDLIAYEDPNYDPANVPEWIREAGGVPLGQTDAGLLRMFIPDFAHMDLNLIPLAWEEGDLLPHWTGTQLRDELINSAAPWLRRAANLLIQTENPYNFFYKEEMEPDAPAPFLMRMLASRPGALPLLDGIMRMAGFEQGAHIEEDSGKLRIDSNMAMVLQEFLPVIRQLDFAFYLPMTIGTFQGEGAVERAIQDFTGAQDDYEGAEQFFQMLSYYLGIKNKDVDIEAEKMRFGKDIYYNAVDMLGQDRREVPGAEFRSLQSRRQREASIRRLGG